LKTLLKVLLGIVLLLAVSGAILLTGKQPDAFPDGSQSASRLQPGPFQIERTDEVFIDDSRPTNANGSYAGDAARTLAGSIWHPADSNQGPYPLIVYSHGFSSMRDGGAYLAEHLASLGYIVVSVDYPLTNMKAPGGPEVKDVVNQPADVSFLISSLIKQSQTPGNRLEGLVDDTRIGVTGLSLGGMTTALVSYHPTLRDHRIKAALSIAGPTSVFTEVFFSHADLPFLMLAGDIDALVPYDSNAAPVPDRVHNSELITITGASHTGFAGPAAPLRWMKNPDALGCWVVKNSLEEEEQDSWYELIGTPEQGINYDAPDELCQLDPLPTAINVLRQQMITSIIVSSFFQGQFAATQAERDAAQRFLSETLPQELAEVSYRAAPTL
jgi:predicted dienelactone hydrolase